jgi:DNA polymerase-3 subunit beta
MKLIFDQKELSDALSRAIKVVPSRPTHPVLSNLLIVAEDGQISIAATDLSTGLRLVVNGTIEDDGSTTIPAVLLSQIVSKLDGRIILSVVDGQATLETLGGSYEIPTISATEFPQLPSVDAQGMSIDGDLFNQGLNTTAYAVSTEESKAILTSISVKSDGQSVEFAATDGRRLAVCTIPAKDSPKYELLLPAKVIKGLKFADKFVLKISRGDITIEQDNANLTTRQVEGQYPRYSQLIPNKFKGDVQIDRISFLTAIDRMSVMASQKSNVIKIAITPETLTLTADTNGMGKGKETVPCTISGNPPDLFACNYLYLAASLQACQTEKILLQINDPTTPIVIKPVGITGQTHLMMPIQIRG